MDATVDNLRLEMSVLCKTVHRVVTGPVVTIQLPVKGTLLPSLPILTSSVSFLLVERLLARGVFQNRGDFGLSTQSHLSKMNFPKFDGENPKLWSSCCIDYFEMYTVEKFMWINVATMHVTGAATRWLQSVAECVR